MIDKEGQMIQVAVWEIIRGQVKYDYINYNKIKGEYEQRVGNIWIDDIYDYLTEYKRVDEARVKRYKKECVFNL